MRSASAHAEHLAIPAHQHGRHAMAMRSLLALTPFAPGALAAAILNLFDWCHGELRITLAVCLIGAVATGTLLLWWSSDPTSIRRASAYAIAAGLGAAVPLLPFG